MKDTAYLVNTARGGVVDTDALVAALTERTIAGAGARHHRPRAAPRTAPVVRPRQRRADAPLGGNAPEVFRASSVTPVRLILEALRGRRPGT